MAKGTFKLQRDGDKLRRMGYAEPALQVVAENDRSLICKVPGYSSNHSSIRGMRNDHYTPSETRAYEIVSHEECWIVVKEIISWPTKAAPAVR